MQFNPTQEVVVDMRECMVYRESADLGPAFSAELHRRSTLEEWRPLGLQGMNKLIELDSSKCLQLD